MKRKITIEIDLDQFKKSKPLQTGNGLGKLFITKGIKGNGDRVLNASTGPITIVEALMALRFIVANEEKLYPRPDNEGGWRFMKLLKSALENDFATFSADCDCARNPCPCPEWAKEFFE